MPCNHLTHQDGTEVILWNERIRRYVLQYIYNNNVRVSDHTVLNHLLLYTGDISCITRTPEGMYSS